jgi:MFS family permease
MPFRPVSFLLMLAAVFVLVTANGIMSTLIPFRAKLEHFPDLVIGFIGSSFYGGFLIGALIAPALIRRVGHVGGFVVCSLCGGLAALALPFVIEPFVWIGLRLAVGFSLTGLYTIVESWLSGASDNATRGRVLGICSVVQYAAWAAGSQIFTLADPAKFTLFGLGAALFALAVVPFALIRETPPPRPAKLSLDLLQFFKTAPSAAAAGLLIGLANGPLFALSPAFGAEIGFTPVEVGMMMTMFTLGSAAFQIPNGWLSDHVERRRLLVSLAVVAAALEFLLGGLGTALPITIIFAICFVIGAVDAAQYYVAAAHAVDRCGRENAMMAMSAMVVLYGIGAVVGPPMASLVMTLAGASSLYIVQGLTHATLLAFIARQLLAARGDASTPV